MPATATVTALALAPWAVLQEIVRFSKEPRQVQPVPLSLAFLTSKLCQCKYGLKAYLHWQCLTLAPWVA